MSPAQPAVMKTTKPKKAAKLNVRKETVRVLQDEALAAVAGQGYLKGADTNGTSGGCPTMR